MDGSGYQNTTSSPLLKEMFHQTAIKCILWTLKCSIFNFPPNDIFSRAQSVTHSATVWGTWWWIAATYLECDSVRMFPLKLLSHEYALSIWNSSSCLCGRFCLPPIPSASPIYRVHIVVPIKLAPEPQQ